MEVVKAGRAVVGMLSAEGVRFVLGAERATANARRYFERAPS